MGSSLQQFREWAVKTKQVSNPTLDTNNLYPGQCVSLVQQYLYRVFGVAYKPRGNAKDFVPPNFKRVYSDPRPGDVIVYGAGYGNGYGHIGLIDDRGYFLDQNGDKPGKVNARKVPYNNIKAIYRPNRAFTIKTPKKKNPIVVNKRVARKGTATVLVNVLFVRPTASLDKKPVASYAKGEKFKYDSYIIKNGFVWLSYIAKSGKRRYVAEGPYDGNRKNVYVKGGIS